jgi:hypothetical protein
MNLFEKLAQEFISKFSSDVGQAGEAIASGDTKKILGTAYEFLAPPVIQALTYSPEAEAMFIGRKAQGGFWNPKKVAPTYEATKSGLSADDIWKMFRTYIGPEGKMRQEISDKAAKFTEDAPVFAGWENGKGMSSGTVKTYLDHPDFAKAYPDIMEYKLLTSGKPGNGSFDPNEKIITIPNVLDKTYDPNSKNSPLSVLLHELQHAVQDKEGFARGGSPSEFNTTQAAKNLAKVEDSIIKLADYKAGRITEGTIYLPLLGMKTDLSKLKDTQLMPTFKELAKQRKELKFIADSDSFDLYRKLAGEAEARETASRRNLGYAARKYFGPSQFYDVPLESLIVK